MMVSTAVILLQTMISPLMISPGILLNPMTVQAMMKADSTKMPKVHSRQVTAIIKGSPFSVFNSQVEMHDVYVRKKHKKRKRVPQTDQDSDVDDSPSRSEPAKKKRKKRANRRQKSRGIREFTGDHRRILEKAYLFLQKALAIHILIKDAWVEAIEFLELNPEDFSEILSNLIRSRISQFRGCVMAEADKVSLDDPTPENIAEAQDTNRQLVADLEGKFMFLDTSDTATVGRHPVFQKLLNAAFLAPKGQNRRAFYFTGHDLLPEAAFGFLMTATGRHEVVAFDSETYRPVYQASMQFIRKWIAEYNKDVYPANLAEERLREMLSKARKLSETPAKPDQNRRSMFPMDIFS
ncbi:hypothetical protein B0H13DRAFT_2318323 [Mycena leptocephala]|nr:hypothetical protein B0H13DRAFT_2318323 [Mycena leptocephala]